MKHHRCEPAEMVVAFCRTCRHCAQEIEPVHCLKCDGTGDMMAEHGSPAKCRPCNGTGVSQWFPVADLGGIKLHKAKLKADAAIEKWKKGKQS